MQRQLYFFYRNYRNDTFSCSFATWSRQPAALRLWFIRVLHQIPFMTPPKGDLWLWLELKQQPFTHTTSWEWLVTSGKYSKLLPIDTGVNDPANSPWGHNVQYSEKLQKPKSSISTLQASVRMLNVNVQDSIVIKKTEQVWPVWKGLQKEASSLRTNLQCTSSLSTQTPDTSC